MIIIDLVQCKLCETWGCNGECVNENSKKQVPVQKMAITGSLD